MKPNLRKNKLILILSILCFQTLAQSVNTVTGLVTDASKVPLPGVSITVEGTTKGTTTDKDGKYSMSGVKNTDKLVFSYVGYVARTFLIGKQTTINISLSSDDKTLDEVVVVGYGTQRKVETTGSIATLKAEEILQTPVANIAQGIQSRVAGMQITQNSGSPGGSISVRVRGTNSIGGSSEPLYIVDGIQLDGSAESPSAQVTLAGNAGVNLDNKSSASVSPLNSINPNDIESIEILKDASAAAIYGSRAANGVVIITTKQGKSGATKITYDGYRGIQQVNKLVPMLNATQMGELENEIYKNPNRFPDPASLGEGTTWQKIVFRDAPIQSHQLTISGGNDKSKISVGLNYFNQDGIVINSDYSRYSLRLNLTHQANKWLKIGTSIIGSRGITNRVQTAGSAQDGANQGVLGAALSAPPVKKPFNDDGSFSGFNTVPYNYYGELRNPIAIAGIYDRTTSDNILTNLYFEFNLAKGLTYRSSFNLNKTNTLLDMYVPRTVQTESEINSSGGLGGNAIKVNSNAFNVLHESIFTYTKKLAKEHNLKLTGVYGYQNNTNNSNTIQASRFPNDATKNEAVALASVVTVNSGRSMDELVSYMGRINYGFKNRYFLDITTRIDGSSKFGSNNKYGFFPAIAGAWRIIEEPFLKDSKIFSDFKLRGSFGMTGNAAGLSAYQSLGLVVASNGFSYPFNNALGIGVAPSGIANPDLKWEKSEQLNLGLDLSFFNNRVSLVADVYQKTTDDLLFTKQLPLSSGYGNIIGNFASLENKGIELATRVAVLNKAVKWNVGANYSVNRNKLLSLADGAQEFVVSNYNVLKVGYPVGTFKTYVWDGIFQTGESFLPGAGSPRVGGGKEKDVNGDGKITGEDQVITGDANPDFIFGITTDVRYKNFDFNVFLSGVYGNQIFNLMRYTFENPIGGRNALAGLANRWSPTNPVNDFVSGNQSGRIPLADRFLEDGSFLRCKNISLGYTFPKIKGISNLRIYVSANNLFTITNYTGFDPEVNSFGNSNVNIGVDNLVYPVAKSYIGGLQITF